MITNRMKENIVPNSIIQEFSDVYKPELRRVFRATKYGIYHHIKPLLRHTRFRWLRQDILKIVKYAFAEMEKWSLYKSCQSMGFTWPERRRNLADNSTSKTQQSHGCHYSYHRPSSTYSRLLLHSCPCAPSRRSKHRHEAVRHVLFHYSTFGLRNSGATFQLMMGQLFGHLPCCSIVYVDDILVFFQASTRPRAALQVLKLLQENGLIVRTDKCIFDASTVEFLGHQIITNGINPSSN